MITAACKSSTIYIYDFEGKNLIHDYCQPKDCLTQPRSDPLSMLRASRSERGRGHQRRFFIYCPNHVLFDSLSPDRYPVSRREMSDAEQPSSDALRPDQVASSSARTLDVPIIQCRMNAPQLSRTTRRGLESSAVAGSVGSASRLSIARMAFAAMSRRG